MDRIIFMGSPQFALPTLAEIHSRWGEKIVGVFSRSDSAKHRSGTPTPTPVKQWASEHGLSVFEPHSKDEIEKKVVDLAPDLIVVIAYGMILPKGVVEPYFCVNVHASVLPKYRGASPIQAALLAGDEKTGATLIKMNEKMDEGDILAIREIGIEPSDNLASLSEKLAALGASATGDFLAGHEKSYNYLALSQDHAEASYCAKVKKEDFLLDFSKSPKENLGKIRGYFPNAYTVVKNKRLKILAAEISDGKLKIATVQPEGKQAMSYRDYCLGNPEGIAC